MKFIPQFYRSWLPEPRGRRAEGGGEGTLWLIKQTQVFYKPPKAACLAHGHRPLRRHTYCPLLETPLIKGVLVFLLFLCSGRLRDIQVNLAPSSCSLLTLGVHLAHRCAQDAEGPSSSSLGLASGGPSGSRRHPVPHPSCHSTYVVCEAA